MFAPTCLIRQRALKASLPLKHSHSISTPSSSSPKPTLKSRPQPPSRPALPAAKLRALISLHHAASNFITPATLDQVIDAEFSPAFGLGTQPVETSYEDLNSMVLNRRATARMKLPELIGASVRGGTPMSQDVTRHQRTQAALFGTEPFGNAGLETVRDEMRTLATEDLTFEELYREGEKDPLK